VISVDSKVEMLATCIDRAFVIRYLGSASPVLIQERKTKLESYGCALSCESFGENGFCRYMRTLVTVPEFRQCGPLLSFLDNAETETPSDKVPQLQGSLFKSRTMIHMPAGVLSCILAGSVQKMR
jgi:hypothetical protein